jgi:hypothetical protein
VTRALVLACVMLATSVASADVVTVGQCSTPGWSWRQIAHGGTCSPTICTSDSQCGGGHCVEVDRCTRTRNIDQGDAPPDGTYEEPTEQLCAANGSCAATQAHCTHQHECTAPPAPATSGSCSIGHARVAAGWLVVLAALVLAARRRT